MVYKLNRNVNSEVGADKRLASHGSAASDPRLQGLIDHIVENGYAVIHDAFTKEEIEEARGEVTRIADAPPLADGHLPVRVGRNTFEGRNTARIYALANKSRVFDKFALHPDVLALNEHFLDAAYLLNSFQSINIRPGEEPQTMHHDDGYITVPRPHKPFGTAIMVAIDAYTPTNGATVVVPKSHTWGSDRLPQDSEVISTKLPSGSILYFLSTLWHGGGRNTSDGDRVALTVQYCQPWVRQVENQMLAVDFDKLDEMPPRLVELLGYKVAAPFIGHVDGNSPRVAVSRMLERYRNLDKGGEAKL